MTQSTLPVVGSWTVRVNGVKPFAIHGDRYYELLITRVDDASATEMIVRIPEHVSNQPPRAGERVTISFLMGQITSLQRDPTEPT